MSDDMKVRKVIAGFLYAILCFVFAACITLNGIHAQSEKVESEKVESEKKAKAGFADDVVFLSPAECVPGEAVSVFFFDAPRAGNEIKDIKKLKAVLYNTSGKKSAESLFTNLPLNDDINVYTAFITPSSLIKPGEVQIKIENGGDVIACLSLVILKRQFVSETIALDSQNTTRRAAPNRRREEESAMMWALLTTTNDVFYETEKFITPVPAGTRRSSFFGDRRVFKYSNGKEDTSVHAGVDYAVVRGTPVKACASGIVAFAAERVLTGNSIVIEHMPGVYSLYYHLDKMNVEKGQAVKTGDIIAESGNTGLSTGPHLHWEVRVSGENSDPDIFVSRPILDTKMILRNITRQQEGRAGEGGEG